MVFSWFLRKRSLDPTSADNNANAADDDEAANIRLRIEDGLLMAFGPEGDPIPPSLVKSTYANAPVDELRLESGEQVDRYRVLAVLDAQQKAPLCERRSDRWIEAMLGLVGNFEPTSPELLASEPKGLTPPLPNIACSGGGEKDRPVSEWITPLIFQETESASMSKADALLVHGLTDGMTLSAGRYDSALNSWILRPQEVPALALQRTDGAADHVEIDVMAVVIRGEGNSWPVATKTIELA